MLALADMGHANPAAYVRRMSKQQRRIRDRFEAAVVRRAGRLSPRTQKLLTASEGVLVDGQELHPEMRMLLKLIEASGGLAFNEQPLPEARAELRKTAEMLGGAPLPMANVKDLMISGDEGPIGARFYTPAGTSDTLLLFFHGGGFVAGDLESHDKMCRFLATHSSSKVLAVDYRRAPEAPFPAAPLDAFAAFRWAYENAAAIGIDPAAIAVGGDSAGANLAAGVCVQARDAGGPRPAFQLHFFPAMDLSTRPESYETFSAGYVLTAAVIEHWFNLYISSPGDALNPLASPMLANLSDLPPAYIALAGFDPVRDDGEKFAEQLRLAGVPVALRRHTGLIHGFSVATGFGTQSAAAMHEAAGALRIGLAVGRKARAQV